MSILKENKTDYSVPLYSRVASKQTSILHFDEDFFTLSSEGQTYPKNIWIRFQYQAGAY